MADLSYEDSVRRALGVPTPAEKAAKVAEDVRRARALQDDQPRRQALIAEFNRTVGQSITATCNELQGVAQEALMELAEAGGFPPPDNVLIERIFRAHAARSPGAKVPARKPLIATLEFRLFADGNMKIDVWRGAPGSSSPPIQPVSFAPRIAALADVTVETVRAAFRDYLAGARALLNSLR